MSSPDPHTTPCTEGMVGSVDAVAPPWHFAPPPENIVAAGATRESGFSGTPSQGFSTPSAPSDPHAGDFSCAPGEWRVPK